jgi:hypothetical protein
MQYDFNVIFNKFKLPTASSGESSTVRTFYLFLNRSPTPSQAAGNALAVSVQQGGTNAGKKLDEQKRDND